jgi:hypothetical protein
MSIFISMLRGINVGGQKKMRMETLRGIYEEMGFTKTALPNPRVSNYIAEGAQGRNPKWFMFKFLPCVPNKFDLGLVGLRKERSKIAYRRN